MSFCKHPPAAFGQWIAFAAVIYPFMFAAVLAVRDIVISLVDERWTGCLRSMLELLKNAMFVAICLLTFASKSRSEPLEVCGLFALLKLGVDSGELVIPPS